ncbi:hypothetical protein A1O3_02883 [Capronia epimyces CBS 606.96]|uniref:GH16 domain-containing protein n=1 Tax=Capronia epimyces CBS 606.96 TaxID=1182542 RepID=W9YKP5_9EURO|nr:uncharacterized protein A1O3_02883 [Capronia epimyces CBS 606.96]EXJ89816.1 hypothetical protein A1O3_02883 [Capronia epimyces CBS 606.96]
MKYDWTNVELKDNHLVLKQRGFSRDDLSAYRNVSIAGIQSRTLDMVPGTYRTVFRLDGAKGGACSGFFWYHDDKAEIDIEIVTPGDSMVNGTINYTLHPSLAPDGSPIANATLSVPLDDSHLRPDTFHEYRFDYHAQRGVQYYLDGALVHTNARDIATLSGNLQFKLWADGNKWWSGTPSTADVLMNIKSIDAYFNSSGTDTDTAWMRACSAAGGPSSLTICTIQ